MKMRLLRTVQFSWLQAASIPVDKGFPLEFVLAVRTKDFMTDKPGILTIGTV